MKLQSLKFFDQALTGLLRRLPRKRAPISTPKNILIIKLSAMGDVLCLMPAVRMLSETYPECQIDWLTTRRSHPGLFASLSFIRQTHLMPTSPGALFVFALSFLRPLRRYDLVIDCDQYYKVSELVAYLSRSSAGFRAPLKGWTFAMGVNYHPRGNEKTLFRSLIEHVVTHYRGHCAAYRADLPELLQGFVPGPALLQFAEALSSQGRPVVVLYPGSSDNAAFRRWPSESYAQVARALAERCQCLIAGGPDEAGLRPVFAAQGLSDIDLIGRWSLKEWSWLFRHKVHLFVGNDAGLLHVAESQNLPIFGIFGPNIGAKWGSLNPQSRCIEVDLPCRPCLRSFEGHMPASCSRGDLACLVQVTPDRVIHDIRFFLEAVSVTAK